MSEIRKKFLVDYFVAEKLLEGASGNLEVNAFDEKDAMEVARQWVWKEHVYKKTKRAIVITTVKAVPDRGESREGVDSSECPACGAFALVKEEAVTGFFCSSCGEKYASIDVLIKRRFAHEAAKKMFKDRDGGKKK